MAYEKLIEMFKEEVDKEMNIREELTFKKGYVEGLKDGVRKAEEAFEENKEEIEVEGYVDGLEDMHDIITDIINMGPDERMELFECTSIAKIFDKFSAVDLLKLMSLHVIAKTVAEALEDGPEEEPEEKETKDDSSEFIGDLLDSNLSDDAKKAIMAMLDALGDRVVIKKVNG